MSTFSNYALQDPWFWRRPIEMGSGARKVDKVGPFASTRATLLSCFICWGSTLNFPCKKESTTDKKNFKSMKYNHRIISEILYCLIPWSTFEMASKGSRCQTLWGTDHCIWLELQFRATKSKPQYWNYLPNKPTNSLFTPLVMRQLQEPWVTCPVRCN